MPHSLWHDSLSKWRLVLLTGVKEKALIEESQHVQKYEDLFENVRNVTGHNDLERVVNEFTAKDEENFAR